jgi:hypothetical protein
MTDTTHTLDTLLRSLRGLRAQSDDAWQQAIDACYHGDTDHVDTVRRGVAAALATTALAQWDEVLAAVAARDFTTAITAMWPAAAAARDWGDAAPEDAAIDAIREYRDYVEPACQCGELGGPPCGWRGPRSKMRRIKFVPPSERATQTAAGRTVHDLFLAALVTATCEAGCAEALIAADPDWVAYADRCRPDGYTKVDNMPVWCAGCHAGGRCWHPDHITYAPAAAPAIGCSADELPDTWNLKCVYQSQPDWVARAD